MPKVAACALIWLPEQALYELRNRGMDCPLYIRERDQFIQTIPDHSFSFQGRCGHLTLRKETRQHGQGYWYAYRNQGRRTLKRYAGRAADLTVARLEEIAGALNAERYAEESSRALVTISTDKENCLRGGEDAPARKRATDTAQPPLLLTPKLSLPRLSPALVERERLLARLDAGLKGKLTLFSAPAGFGKTTLARQWIARLSKREDGPAVAWVSLECGDNDPMRFWSYVMMACQTFEGRPGQTALTLLHTSEQPSFEQTVFETPLTLLLNDLNQLSRQSLLVLEDYHVITATQVHTSLTFLLDHLPATLHLVILARTDLTLPLTRLRANGLLNEFRADDLRFSQEETGDFLRQTLALSPAPELLRHLDETFEGWIAGLRLLTLSLRTPTSTQTLEQQLATFSGSRRHLLEYFASEVLNAQPETLQVFLLQTSMLQALTAPLCDALSERNDSAQLLEALEKANLFLSPLDGDERWYRYHPLFAEALRREAKQRLGETALRACAQRASAWYAQHGLLAEAIESALAAHSFAQAAMLIEQLTGPQRFHEMHEHQTLQRWLEALPASVLEQHPLLCLTLAMVRLFASNCHVSLSTELLARVEQPLRMAEHIWQTREDTAGLGEALALRTVLARFQKRPDLATSQASLALTMLAENAYQWRATCLSALGNQALMDGDVSAARRLLREARVYFAAAGNDYGARVTLLTLGEICLSHGELSQATELYAEVLASAEDDLTDRGWALLGLARIAYARNELTRAEQATREVYELGQRLLDEKMQAQAARLLADLQYPLPQMTLDHQPCAALPAVSLPFQPVEPLSPQEQRVLALLTAGLSNKEIAESLIVSPNTVKTQVQSIYRKLNAHSRKEVRKLLRAPRQS